MIRIFMGESVVFLSIVTRRSEDPLYIPDKLVSDLMGYLVPPFYWQVLPTCFRSNETTDAESLQRSYAVV